MFILAGQILYNMKNSIRYFSSRWKSRIAPARHNKCIRCLIGGGGLFFLGVFVFLFGLPILLIEFLEKRIKRRKRRVKHVASIEIDEGLKERIIYAIVRKEFYMCDFTDHKMAAEHLGIPTEVLVLIMEEMGVCFPAGFYLRDACRGGKGTSGNKSSCYT